MNIYTSKSNCYKMEDIKTCRCDMSDLLESPPLVHETRRQIT